MVLSKALLSITSHSEILTNAFFGELLGDFPRVTVQVVHGGLISLCVRLGGEGQQRIALQVVYLLEDLFEDFLLRSVQLAVVVTFLAVADASSASWQASLARSCHLGVVF